MNSLHLLPLRVQRESGTSLSWSVTLLGVLLTLPLSAATSSDEGVFFATAEANAATSPSITTVIPPGRPQWLLNADSRAPREPWAVVTAGPFPTQEECEAALEEEVYLATASYVNELLGSPQAASLLQLSSAELLSKLAPNMQRYEETVQVSFGPRQQLHVRLAFSPDFQRDMLSRWKSLQQFSRLLQVALLSTVVMALLYVLQRFFAGEQQRGPAASPGLQWSTAAGILGVVLAGIAASRWIYWL
jgi:hypothetical protein